MYKVVNHLASLNLVDLQLDDSRLLTVKLKCVPIFYRNSPDEPSGKFDLRHSQRVPQNLVIRQVSLKKIPEVFRISRFREDEWKYDRTLIRPARSLDADLGTLYDLGLASNPRVSKERAEALSRILGYEFIVPDSTAHHDINYLFWSYVKRLRESVVVLWDGEKGDYLVLPAQTRYTNLNILKEDYNRAKKGLEVAFRTYHDAIFLTLSLPAIFPLVVYASGRYVFLQHKILNELSNDVVDFVRHHWKDREIKVFKALEFHEDGRLHLHMLIFGIPYLFEWFRPVGRKKEPALYYYARKLGIRVTRHLRKRPSLLAKFILTRLLDKWLTRILSKLDNALGTRLLQTYLTYKKTKRIDGPVNEVHRIKDGKWHGSKPKDARGPNAVKYVLKYLLKMIHELTAHLSLNDPPDPDRAKPLSLKLLGYWLFAKPFYRHSRGLIRPRRKRKDRPKYNYVGLWRAIDLPEYVKPYYLTS